MDIETLLVFYHEVIAVWEGFCKLHFALYDKTCDEYSALLESKIEEVEIIVPEKENIILEIGILEKERQAIISRMNDLIEQNHLKIKNVGNLIGIMQEFENLNDSKVLTRYNALLINMIERIQEQNKTNQIFLNKAIASLGQIKNDFSGKKQFSTYTAAGKSKSNVVKDRSAGR